MRPIKVKDEAGLICSVHAPKGATPFLRCAKPDGGSVYYTMTPELLREFALALNIAAYHAEGRPVGLAPPAPGPPPC